MHITLTMSTSDANFKGYIQIRWVMCIMSKYINAQQWIHQSLKKIAYSVDFHIEVGLKTKPAGDILSKMFFIYIILCIYIFKEFFKDILESNRNYEIKTLRVT